jgi:hypothetical protein
VLSSANAKPSVVTLNLKQGLAQEMENLKSECLLLLCFATKFQYVNSFYKEVQAVHALINILCAVKEHDTVSSW